MIVLKTQCITIFLFVLNDLVDACLSIMKYAVKFMITNLIYCKMSLTTNIKL